MAGEPLNPLGEGHSDSKPGQTKQSSKGRTTPTDNQLLQLMRVGHWANHPIPENIAITETIDTQANPHYLGEAVVSNLGREREGNMTTLGEVRREAQRPNTPLVNPRTKFYIGNWNVRTMFASGRAAQITREMRLADIEILGISESRWSGSGRMRLSTGETVIYSGRDDDIHQQGVAIMMSKSVTCQ